MATWWTNEDMLDTLDLDEDSIVSRVIRAVGLFGDILSLEDVMASEVKGEDGANRSEQIASGEDKYEEERPGNEVTMEDEAGGGKQVQDRKDEKEEDLQGVESKDEAGKVDLDKNVEEEKEKHVEVIQEEGLEIEERAQRQRESEREIEEDIGHDKVTNKPGWMVEAEEEREKGEDVEEDEEQQEGRESDQAEKVKEDDEERQEREMATVGEKVEGKDNEEVKTVGKEIQTRVEEVGNEVKDRNWDSLTEEENDKETGEEEAVEKKDEAQYEEETEVGETERECREEDNDREAQRKITEDEDEAKDGVRETDVERAEEKEDSTKKGNKEEEDKEKQVEGEYEENVHETEDGDTAEIELQEEKEDGKEVERISCDEEVVEERVEHREEDEKQEASVYRVNVKEELVNQLFKSSPPSPSQGPGVPKVLSHQQTGNEAPKLDTVEVKGEEEEEENNLGTAKNHNGDIYPTSLSNDNETEPDSTLAPTASPSHSDPSEAEVKRGPQASTPENHTGYRSKESMEPAAEMSFKVGSRGDEPGLTQNLSPNTGNTVVGVKGDNGDKEAAGQNSSMMSGEAEDKNKDSCQSSKYKTVSYRRIRRGNTRQRIDEFEAMMDS